MMSSSLLGANITINLSLGNLLGWMENYTSKVKESKNIQISHLV